MLRARRRSYTLVELLITVSIIGIMASMVLFALFSAQEQARVQKTRTLIAKLNNIVMARYDSYRTRRAPVQFSNETPQERAKIRLDVLRDLMRMEMPDRWSDVYEDPVTPFGAALSISRTSTSRAYFDRYQQVNGGPNPPPDTTNQGAESLYMTVMEAVAREGDAREVFRAESVADTDADGFPEFVDAWGTPIRFLRWAPGFLSDLQQIGRGNATLVDPGPPVVIFTLPGATLSQDPARYLFGSVAVVDATGSIERIDPNRMARITDYQYDDRGTLDTSDDLASFTCATVNGTPPFGGAPPSAETVVIMPADPLDARGVYPNTMIPSHTFALYPLIYSAGSDRADGITSQTVNYPASQLDPFQALTNGFLIGSFLDTSADPNFYVGCWNDNIHNHQLNRR